MNAPVAVKQKNRHNFKKEGEKLANGKNSNFLHVLKLLAKVFFKF